MNSTTADNRCTQQNGWCHGEIASVVLTATDQNGLSGVKEIHYRIDDGAWASADGSSVTVDVALSDTGSATVQLYAVDNAETIGGVSLKWDNLSRSSATRLPPPPTAPGGTGGRHGPLPGHR